MLFSSTGTFSDLHASARLRLLQIMCGAPSTTAGFWDHCEVGIITCVTEKRLSAFVCRMHQSMPCFGLFLWKQHGYGMVDEIRLFFRPYQKWGHAILVMHR